MIDVTQGMLQAQCPFSVTGSASTVCTVLFFVVLFFKQEKKTKTKNAHFTGKST
jgi:hypothetical protein